MPKKKPAVNELGEPVGPRGLHTICTDPDDGARNWFVTLAYRDLSRLTAVYTHGRPMTATPANVPRPDQASGQSASPTTAGFDVSFGAALKSGEDLVAKVARKDGATMNIQFMATTPESSPSGKPSPADMYANLAGLKKGIAPRATTRNASSEHPLNANFCTFAMWSSLTIGRDIRNSKLPRRFDRMTGLALRHTATNLVIEARRTHHMELSKVLGLGQRRILWDVGTGLYSMFIAEEHGIFARDAKSLDGLVFNDFDKDSDFTDVATNELADMIGHWIPVPVEPRRDDGLTQLRTRDLALGLASYHLARVASQRSGDNPVGRKWVAQLILRGNLLIAAYEQHRVDQLLKYPVDDFASEFFLERTGAEAVEQNGGGRWRKRLANRARRDLLHLPEIWGRFFTDQIMVLWAGDELLRLGRDQPFPPGAATFVPDELDVIEDAWLRMLLRRYDHSYGNGHGTQSRIWSVFDDRMNYIVNFMRSRAQSPGLWQEPFEPSETDDLRCHKVPKGKHDRSA